MYPSRRAKITVAFSLLIVALAVASVAAQSGGYWTFDGDNAGFETYTIDEQNTPWPFMTIVSSLWSAVGGHEDGHIYSGTTPGYNGRFYAIWQNGNAAAPALGNLFGKTIRTDLRRDNGAFISGSGANVLAYWAIGDSIDYATCNLWLSKAAYAVDVSALPQDQWTQRSIELIESNFFPWPNCVNPSKTFEQLAGSYNYVGFSFLSDQVTEDAADPWNRYTQIDGVWRFPHYGAYSNSNAVFRIDNFGPTDAMSYDFGDLPDVYHTTHASNGPRHEIGASHLQLGTAVQSEPDGTPTTDASGDGAEEDGVTRQAGLGGASNNNGWTEGTVVAGDGGSLAINISGGSGYPQVFMDFNGSQALVEITLRGPDGTALALPLGPGTHRVYFDIPAGTFGAGGNPIPTRVRLSSSGGLSATGTAVDGEVEDYIWQFGPTAVTLVDVQATTPSGISWRWIGVLIAFGTGTVFLGACRKKNCRTHISRIYADF